MELIKNSGTESEKLIMGVNQERIKEIVEPIVERDDLETLEDCLVAIGEKCDSAEELAICSYVLGRHIGELASQQSGIAMLKKMMQKAAGSDADGR